MSEARSSHLPEPALESFLELICAPHVEPAGLSERFKGFNTTTAGPEICSMLPLLAARWGAALAPGILREAEEIRHAILFANTLTLARLAEVLKQLETEGIQTMVLKGAALVTEFYADPGLRFMEDTDVLIRQKDVPKALELLAGTGWRWDWPRRLSAMALASSHAIDMKTEDGIKLDLHWHPWFQMWHPGDAESFWNLSHDCSILGARSKVLCSAHQLLHVCIHGARRQVHQGRWIVDATTILQKAPDLDWEQFCREAEQRQFSLTISVALGYLRDRYRALVPSEVIEHLQRIPVSDWERADYQGLTTRNKASIEWARVGLMWRRYRLLMPDRAGLRIWSGFPIFLQHHLHQRGISGLWIELVKGRFQ